MEPIVNVVLPVFAILAAGYLAGRVGILGEGGSQALNAFTYWVAMPPLFVVSLWSVPLGDILNWPFLGALLGGTAATAVLAGLVGRYAFGNRGALMVMHAYTASFANVGYMGIPLFIAATGETGTLLAILSTAALSSVLLSAAIVGVETTLSRAAGPVALGRDVGRALATNPMLLGVVLGLAMNASGLAMPKAVETFGSLLGNAAGPCALFAIGLFLVGKPLAAGIGEVAWLSLAKLAVQPAIAWALGRYVFALPEFDLAAVTILSALPAAALCFVVAQRYGVYVQRSSAAILISTVGSVLTLSALFVHFGLG